MGVTAPSRPRTSSGSTANSRSGRGPLRLLVVVLVAAAVVLMHPWTLAGPMSGSGSPTPRANRPAIAPTPNPAGVGSPNPSASPRSVSSTPPAGGVRITALFTPPTGGMEVGLRVNGTWQFQDTEFTAGSTKPVYVAGLRGDLIPAQQLVINLPNYTNGSIILTIRPLDNSPSGALYDGQIWVAGNDPLGFKGLRPIAPGGGMVMAWPLDVGH